jgi:uncharacterized damage-inducible protein DinB
MTLCTLQELYAFNRWANDKTLAIADALSAEQLDRPFEMGLGSIRNTLHHVWAAERVWMDRWAKGGVPKFVFPEAGLPIAELRERYHATGAERDAFLATKNEADLAKPLTFTNIKGETYSLPLGGQMMHVVNPSIIGHRSSTWCGTSAGGPAGLDYISTGWKKSATPTAAGPSSIPRKGRTPTGARGCWTSPPNFRTRSLISPSIWE